MQAEIKTARLTLRQPTAADAPAIQAAANDLEVSRWVTHVPHPYTLADAQDYIARVRSGALGQTYVVDDAKGFAGTVGLAGELGYWVARRAWGRGYATEAAHALLTANFRDPHAPALGSSHFEGNDRSAHVLAKLGFGYLGDGSKLVTPRATGTPIKCHGMTLTPEHWHALNPWRITTPRLELRAIQPGDTADCARIGGDPRVAPMIFAATIPWAAADAARFIECWRWRGRLGFRMAITRQGKFIGTVGVAPPGPDGIPNVMYFLDPAQWGQRLMTEALGAFLPALVDRFRLPAVTADVFIDNPASARVLEKLRFQRTGTGTGTSAARLEPAPVWLYRLHAHDLKATP